MSKIKYIYLLLISLFATEAAVAQGNFNKCMIEGKPVYQQSLCPESGETVKQSLERKRKSDETNAENLRLGVEEQRLRQERLDTRPASSLSTVERAERELRESTRKVKELEQKIADGTFDREFQAELNRYCNGKVYELLIIGMSEDQMLHCSIYRRPKAINVTTTPQGSLKQYVFNLHGTSSKSTYVYFRNGKLNAIQD